MECMKIESYLQGKTKFIFVEFEGEIKRIRENNYVLNEEEIDIYKEV